MSAIRIQSGARRSISRTFNGCGVSLSIGDPLEAAGMFNH